MSELTTSQETEVNPPQIKTQKELAFSLGFRFEEEQSDTRFKIYTKPLKTQQGEGLLVLTFDTVYNRPLSGKKYQYERFGLAVRLGNSPSWETKIPRPTLSKALSELAIQANEFGDFSKQALRAGGYQKLHDFLASALESSGTLGKTSGRLLEKMAVEYNQGVEFIEKQLLPAVKEKLPEYPFCENKYSTEKELFFWRQKKKGYKTTSVILFRVGPNRVLIEVGRSRIREGHVDMHYFYSRGGRMTIAPPDKVQDLHNPRSSWTFNELELALDDLEKYLETQSAK